MTLMRPCSRAGSRAADALVAQLLALLGPGWRATGAHRRDWASATFIGARHRFEFQASASTGAADAARLRNAIGDHDFTLDRAFVNDAAIVATRTASDSACAVTVEVLVIEDG